MSKSFKVVSDFEFPKECGFSGSAGKTMVKGYARGGHADVAKDKAMVKTAVHKHEKSMHKGEPLTKLAAGGAARAKDALRNERAEMSRIKQETRSERKDAGQEMSRVRREMRYDEQKLKGAQQPMRKQYPVDRREPMIAMKKGGMTPTQQAKVGKVMGEFKAGELHSGSKTGPMVKNPKQAVAIAMSEAGKKKK